MKNLRTVEEKIIRAMKEFAYTYRTSPIQFQTKVDIAAYRYLTGLFCGEEGFRANIKRHYKTYFQAKHNPDLISELRKFGGFASLEAEL